MKGSPNTLLVVFHPLHFMETNANIWYLRACQCKVVTELNRQTDACTLAPWARASEDETCTELDITNCNYICDCVTKYFWYKTNSYSSSVLLELEPILEINELIFHVRLIGMYAREPLRPNYLYGSVSGPTLVRSRPHDPRLDAPSIEIHNGVQRNSFGGTQKTGAHKKGRGQLPTCKPTSACPPESESKSFEGTLAYPPSPGQRPTRRIVRIDSELRPASQKRVGRLQLRHFI